MKKSQTQTKKQIKRILEKEGLKFNESNIRQIKKGNVNKIFIYNENIVLRFSDDSTSTERLVREAKLLKRLKSKIPVPEVCSYGSIEKIGYQILSYVPGDRLSNVWPALSRLDKKELVSQFSGILNILHSINATTYRTICVPSIGHKTWLEYYDKEFDKVVRYIKTNLPREDIKASQKFYSTNRQLLSESSTATLVHSDLIFDNILVYRKHISAILDFEFAAYASVDYELYKLEEFARNPAHYGYAENKSSYYDFMKLLKKIYPDIFNKRNLAKKLNLYDFVYTWKAFKYNDEFNMIKREKNWSMTQAKLTKILSDRISRII